MLKPWSAIGGYFNDIETFDPSRSVLQLEHDRRSVMGSDRKLDCAGYWLGSYGDWDS